MTYRLLVDGVVCFHIVFVVFVLCGGFLVMYWPRLSWVHLPCAGWGIAVEPLFRPSRAKIILNLYNGLTKHHYSDSRQKRWS